MISSWQWAYVCFCTDSRKERICAAELYVTATIVTTSLNCKACLLALCCVLCHLVHNRLGLAEFFVCELFYPASGDPRLHAEHSCCLISAHAHVRSEHQGLCGRERYAVFTGEH